MDTTKNDSPKQQEQQQETNTSMQLDQHGGPIVPLPPTRTVSSTLKRWFQMSILGTIVIPIFLFVSLIKQRLFTDVAQLYRLVSQADKAPIQEEDYYQDSKLLKELWKLPSAKHYLSQTSSSNNTDSTPLEYQIREGYCSSATLRCILKSFPSIPHEVIPVQKPRPSNPDRWCENLEKELSLLSGKKNSNDSVVSNNNNNTIITTKIIRPDDSINNDATTVLQQLRQGLENPNCRVVINYLRPALVGFSKHWFPVNWFLGVFSGHFSLIVGLLEQNDGNPLVAIFDVNHSYGGVYFAPFGKVYEAIKANDLTTQQSRAIIILEEKNVEIKK